MKGLGCLLRDTQIVKDISAAMQVFVAERLQDNKSATFPMLYAALREGGVEVDAVSAGTIYSDLFKDYSDPAISTDEEIDEFTEKGVRDQMKELVDAELGQTTPQEEKQIGKMPPERQVANTLGRMFKAFEFGTEGQTKSAMLKMQELVAKAARTLMPQQAGKAAKEITQTLNDFFDTEAIKFRTLSGGMNTLRTLYSETQKEVSRYLDEATKDMSDVDADLLRQKWDNYMQGFMDSSYDLMLSKGEQNKLLKESLRQVKVNGIDVVNVNGNINWGVLMEHNNPAEIADSVARLYRDGVRDSSGNETKYSPDQARRIGEYFQGLYEDKLARVQQQKAALNRTKNTSAANIISDFIKDQGYFKLIKDRNGTDLMMQSDWTKALKQILKSAGKSLGLDAPIKELRDFLANQKDDSGNPKYTADQINIIENEFKRVVSAKVLPGTASASALRKFTALNRLNKGNAFNEQSQQALNHIVGVGGLNQQVINQLRQLATATQQILNMGSPTNGSTSANPSVNRGAYAFQALAQVDRRIREIVRENKLSRSDKQKAAKYVSDLLTATSTTLLINPNNAIENVLTGIATNVAESINMIFSMPKLYQFGKAQKDFWTGWASYVGGGAAVEVVNDEDITSDLQSGERLRSKAFFKEISNRKTALSAVLKSPAYAVNIFARTFMNSFDAGNNAALLRKRAVGSVYNQLVVTYVGEGLTESEARKNALDDMQIALNVDKSVADEIKQQNNQIMDILKANGMTPTFADRQQNERDMMLSLYADVIAKASPKATVQRQSEITRALVESASTQARVLGGKKRMPVRGAADALTRSLYYIADAGQGLQKSYFEQMQQYEQEGKLGKAAWKQVAGTVAQNFIGRFLGGIANFGALAITATPFGFLNSYSLSQQRKDYIERNPTAGFADLATPGDIRKTSELYGLQRSIAVRAAMGTFALTSYVLSKMIDDDDEEDGFLKNLQETRTGRRMIQKYMPISIAFASAILNDSYDKKGRQVNPYSAALEVVLNASGQQDEGFLTKALRNAKGEDEQRELLVEFLGSKVPNANLNQIEQSTKWFHLVQSAFDRDKIGTVINDEEVSSDIYKSAEGFVDAMLINSATDLIRRSFSSDEKVNRYKLETN